jgi:hypothetical protein
MPVDGKEETFDGKEETFETAEIRNRALRHFF